MSQPLDLNELAQKIKQWGAELGFQKVGITDTDLPPASQNCRPGWTNNTTAKWSGWRVMA
jgi:epoxyqueuosine reductase QueG